MRQGKLLFRLSALCTSILITSCSIIDPAEDIPSYIHIEKFDLTTTFDQGTASHNITDAWVYLDQNIVGVFELPATIPILTQGSSKLIIRPGIKINGIASTRIYYPFYKGQEQTLDLKPARIDTLSLSTTYQDNVVFKYLEGFENPGIPFTATPSSDTAMEKVIDPSLVFEGTASAVIRLDKERPLFECISNNAYKLPTGAAPVYLEINFKNNNPLVIGLIANTLGGVRKLEIVVLNTTATWKKIYVNLGPTINRQSQVVDFNIYMNAYLTAGQDEAEIYIDNLKLIHY